MQEQASSSQDVGSRDASGAVAGPPVAATIRADPWAHRRGEPRTFIAAWILLLLLSILLVLGSVGMTGLVSTEVYRPAAVRLLLLIGTCAFVLWPMIRLSQEGPARPARAFLGDVMIVVGSSCIILLPQSLPWMANWPVDVALCAASWLAAWTLLIGGLLAWYFARRRESWTRAGMMLVMLILAAGEPFFRVMMGVSEDDGVSPTASSMMSGLGGLAEICRERVWSGESAIAFAAHWWGVATVLGGAVLCWIAARTRASRAHV